MLNTTFRKPDWEWDRKKPREKQGYLVPILGSLLPSTSESHTFFFLLQNVYQINFREQMLEVCQEQTLQQREDGKAVISAF